MTRGDHPERVRIGARPIIAARSVLDIPPDCLAGSARSKVTRCLAPTHAASIE